MFRSASVLSLTILLALVPLPFAQSPVANAENKCLHGTDESRLAPRDVNHYYDGCAERRKPKLQEHDTWGYEEKDKKPPDKTDKPRYKIRYHEQCAPGNEDVHNCDSNPDITKCDDGTFPLIRQIFTINEEFVRQRRYCSGDPLPTNIEETDFIEPLIITPDRFRSFPIEGSELTSNPHRFSLRNGHTHFWATKDTQEFTSNLSGADVRIRAIPIQWNWNYGDGATNSFDFPGEPAPNHTLRDETSTSHSYSDTGTFQVNVTTLYRGEFSVDGGTWQAIPGQAAVPSEPIEIDVWRTEKELIANE